MARIGPIERYGLLGAKRIASAGGDRVDDTGRRLRPLGALVLDGVDVVRDGDDRRTTPGSANRPAGVDDVRSQPIVRRRDDSRQHTARVRRAAR